jgi:hypothetical protein
VKYNAFTSLIWPLNSVIAWSLSDRFIGGYRYGVVSMRIPGPIVLETETLRT